MLVHLWQVQRWVLEDSWRGSRASPTECCTGQHTASKRSVGPCSMPQILAHVLLKTAVRKLHTYKERCFLYPCIPIFLYAVLLLVCLLFYFNPVIVLPIILFNSYIPRHRRYASSFKHFPTWLPVSGCSKQCLLKDLCVDTIIIQQRISGKTIVFNEGIWGSNEILKNFVDDYTSYRRSNILYSHQCTFFSNSCQIISNILLVCKVMLVY